MVAAVPTRCPHCHEDAVSTCEGVKCFHCGYSDNPFSEIKKRDSPIHCGLKMLFGSDSGEYFCPKCGFILPINTAAK